MVLLGLLSLLTIPLIVEGVDDAPGGPAPVFVALWVVMLVWHGYRRPVRVISILEVEGGSLRWEAPLRRGEVALGDLVAVFVCRSGRPVLVQVSRGFTDFAALLAGRRPGLPVRVGWRGRLAEELSGGPPRASR